MGAAWLRTRIRTTHQKPQRPQPSGPHPRYPSQAASQSSGPPLKRAPISAQSMAPKPYRCQQDAQRVQPLSKAASQSSLPPSSRSLLLPREHQATPLPLDELWMQGRGSVQACPKSRAGVQSPRRRNPTQKHARSRGRRFRSRRKQRPPTLPNPKACPHARAERKGRRRSSNSRAAVPKANKERSRAPLSQHRGNFHCWGSHPLEGFATRSFS